MCVVNLFLNLYLFTLPFSPLSMPFNRVIVPTVGRLQCVYVHCCCREQTAVRCVWTVKEHRGPVHPVGCETQWLGLFSLYPSICLSYSGLSIPLWQCFSHMLDPFCLLCALFYFLFLFSFFSVCVCLSAAMWCVSSWQLSLISCPLAVKSVLSLDCQYACSLLTNYLWKQWRMDEFPIFKYNSMLANSNMHIDTHAHRHTHSPLFCLYASVADVVFSASLHFHT